MFDARTRASRILSALVMVAVLSTMLACAKTPHTLAVLHPKGIAAAFSNNATLTGLFMQCLIDAHAQYLPVAVAIDLCSARLEAEMAKDVDRPLDTELGHAIGNFDPASVIAACGSADAKHSADYSKLSDAELRAALQAAKEARAAAGASHDKEAENYYNDRASELFDEIERREEPGDAGGNVSHPVGGGEAVCEEVANNARQLLAECARTQWHNAACEVLKSKLGHCVDPRFAYVDPEQGTICAELPDPQLVVDAYVAQCKSNTDGGTACAPPKPPDGTTPTWSGTSATDLCRNPRAQIDPDSGTCVVPLQVVDPTHPTSIQQLIVIIYNAVGGPAIVLPKTGRDPVPPRPGDPRPGPH